MEFSTQVTDNSTAMRGYSGIPIHPKKTEIFGAKKTEQAEGISLYSELEKSKAFDLALSIHAKLDQQVYS